MPLPRNGAHHNPPHSVFVGNGYVQHAGAGWSGTESLRYHMYVIPHGYHMRDNVAFAYRWSLRKPGDPPANLRELFDIPDPAVLPPAALPAGSPAAGSAGSQTAAKTTDASQGEPQNDDGSHCEDEYQTPTESENEDEEDEDDGEDPDYVQVAMNGPDDVGGG